MQQFLTRLLPAFLIFFWLSVVNNLHHFSPRQWMFKGWITCLYNPTTKIRDAEIPQRSKIEMVSPTCPSGDCFYKLMSNSVDNGQETAERGPFCSATRLGDESGLSCCFTNQWNMQTPAEVWSHIRRGAPIVVSLLSAEDQRALIFNYRLTHRELFGWLEGKEALNQQLFLYIFGCWCKSRNNWRMV